MHTILGAGGLVSNALTRELEKTNQNVRLVSRRNISVAGDTTWQKADLLNFKETLEASRSSEVIYLCAGLKYDKEVWKREWPVLMQNVINVAKETGARLLFFDNVYMYGQVSGAMTEQTPYNPCSIKGEVRAKIAETFMNEVKAGNITGSIARAADFYGATDSMNSFFDSMVLAKLSKRQTPQWLGNPKSLHSFTYVPDAAKGMFRLGQSRESDNQIWHLTTAAAITGKEFLEIASGAFNQNPKSAKINKFLLQVAGLFNPLIKETVEMYYQYSNDYNFNSDKFEKAFNVKPTSYSEGIKHLEATYYKN